VALRVATITRKPFFLHKYNRVPVEEEEQEQEQEQQEEILFC